MGKKKSTGSFTVRMASEAFSVVLFYFIRSSRKKLQIVFYLLRCSVSYWNRYCCWRLRRLTRPDGNVDTLVLCCLKLVLCSPFAKAMTLPTFNTISMKALWRLLDPCRSGASARITFFRHIRRRWLFSIKTRGRCRFRWNHRPVPPVFFSIQVRRASTGILNEPPILTQGTWSFFISSYIFDRLTLSFRLAVATGSSNSCSSIFSFIFNSCFWLGVFHNLGFSATLLSPTLP